jgi:hypothetical protein
MVGLALGGAWLLLLAALAGPADAHPGIENPFVRTGVAATVALGVPSEEPSHMVEIDVTLPADFSLQRVDTVPGWKIDSSPGRLRFFDGDIPQGGYAQFTFAGVFHEKRVVELPVTTRAADGTTVNWDQARGGVHPAAEAYPGYAPGAAPVPGAIVSGRSAGGGRRVAALSASVIVVGAAAGLAVAAARRRRVVPGTVRG